MKSSIFKREISKIRFRSINDATALSTAESAAKSPDVMELYSGSECTLDDYVRVLAESIPSREVCNKDIMNFLKAKRLLKNIIEKEENLINWYCNRMKEDRALPILGAEEMAIIIITAFLAGGASELGKKLVNKLCNLFTTKSLEKEQLKEALHLIFSNTILNLLEEHREGLTSNEIAETTGMQHKEIAEYLLRYESQGWIKKTTNQDQKKWGLKKDRAKIIEGYFEQGGG